MITRRQALVLAAAAAGGAAALAQQQPRTFHIKLSTPVDTKSAKAGDPVRAALISPESYLNGYLEGTVERVESGRSAMLHLRFTRLVFKGQTAAVETEVFEFVNSKGHKSVDDDERPVSIENGVIKADGPQLLLDEGSEMRLRNKAI